MKERAHYKLDKTGYVLLSTSVQNRWTNRGNRIVHIADLGSAVVVLRGGLSLPLLELHYPDSKLHKRAIRKEDNFDLPPRLPDRCPPPMQPYINRRIGSIGKCALSPAVFQRWGDKVRVKDLGCAVVVTHPDTEIATDEIVPVDLFQKDEWQYNTDGKLTEYLNLAYVGWRQLLAYRHAVVDGKVEGRATDINETLLGAKIGEVLKQDVQRVSV